MSERCKGIFLRGENLCGRISMESVKDKMSEVVKGLAFRTNARISLLDSENSKKPLKDFQKTGYMIKICILKVIQQLDTLIVRV